MDHVLNLINDLDQLFFKESSKNKKDKTCNSM